MKLLLAKNPALSVKQITPKKQQSITPGKTPLSKKNKYFNIPVYVFSDGFVFVDEDNQINTCTVCNETKTETIPRLNASGK